MHSLKSYSFQACELLDTGTFLGVQEFLADSLLSCKLDATILVPIRTKGRYFFSLLLDFAWVFAGRHEEN